jgi:TonB family protein
MSPARRLIAPFLLAAFAHSAFGQVPGRDAVTAARDLYASARYDEALAVLNDVRPADGAAANGDRKSIEQYRSLCLLALGRGSEAEAAIAAVVTADPTYLPAEADASPRVRAAFSEVRRRLLPEIATSRYTQAKGEFDRKNYGAAAQQFRQVLALIEDPDMNGKLPDLRMLSTGFMDLAVAAMAPPEPAKLQTVAPPAVTVAPAVTQPEVTRIYTMLDKDVTPAVVIRQAMPRLAANVKQAAKDTGVVEVVIDEQGRVTFVAIRQSVHPAFDADLIAAAREWRYQPATLAGKPVKYRKLIQINVSRQH